MAGRILISDEMSYDLRVIHLGDKAFRLYVYAACYAGRWNLEALHVLHVRAAMGQKVRQYIRELVACDLAEWVSDDEFRLLGEGDLWKRVKPNRRRIPDRVRNLVFGRDGHACLECGATESLSLDHIHPHSLGGTDSLENLQTLCRSCNSKKGARV